MTHEVIIKLIPPLKTREKSFKKGLWGISVSYYDGCIYHGLGVKRSGKMTQPLINEALQELVNKYIELNTEEKTDENLS